jgi:hypothetical protein
MIGKLLRAVFVPKGTRAKLDAQTRAGAARRAATPPAAGAQDRERLLEEAMATYREKREVYDNLDEETKRQIEADAAKAFGDLAKPKARR